MRKALILFLILLTVPIKVNAGYCVGEYLNIQKLFEITGIEKYNNFLNMVVTEDYFIILAEEQSTERMVEVRNQALLVYDKTNFELVMDPIEIQDKYVDMAYNKEKKELYLVNGSYYITVIDAKTFARKEDIEADFEINGIAYFENVVILVGNDKVQMVAEDKKNTIDYVIDNPIISINEKNIFNVKPTTDIEENPVSQVNIVGPENDSCIYIKDEYGKIKVVEFDADETTYFLSQTSINTGAVYVLTYNDITTKEEIPIISDTLDVKNMTFKGIVKDKEGKEYEITSENGVFYLNDLTFNAPGNYTFYVTQIKDDHDIIYDEKDVSFTIRVRYKDLELQSLDDPTLYQHKGGVFNSDGDLYIESREFQDNKDYFKNEKLDRGTLSCKEIDGKYYNKEGYEVTKEEYLTSCGLVENPQTGASLPILIMTIGLGIVGIIFYFSKNKIFRI